MKKYWHRFCDLPGEFYCDGARQSDQETLAALNDGERAKEELATMQRDEAQLVELWRSQAFFHEGQEGDECNRTPMQTAVHVLKQLKRQNSTLFSNETDLATARAKAELERLKAELAAYKPTADWREDTDSTGNTKWQLFIDSQWRASMYQLLQGNKIVWATTYLPGLYDTAEEAKAAVEEAMQQSRNA